MLIINADDWGRCTMETDAAMACFQVGGLQSVSAMVFMDDAERAAKMANESGIDVGLHLNFNQSFTGKIKSAALKESHERIVGFMAKSKYAQLLYHPALRSAFRDVYQGQVEEFVRLYGWGPSHVDGHQHRHLCTNMLIQKVIPPGEIVRRSFSYSRKENGRIDCMYRRLVDRVLTSRYQLTDYFFSLSRCLKTKTLDRVYQLAKSAAVELMAHPVVPVERDYLTSIPHLNQIADLPVGNFQQMQPESARRCGQNEPSLTA